MKSRIAYEPGILRTFRIYTGVWLVLSVFTIVIYILTNGWKSSAYLSLLLFSLLDAVLLFAYLLAPRLLILLHNVYLPIGIIWITLGSMIQLDLAFLFSNNETPPVFPVLFILQPMMVLFIPLVLIAWQYSLRELLLFCGLTFLSDLILASFMVSISGVATFLPLIGSAFIRTILFLLVGNMIVNMMQVQREQRKRLTEANDRLVQYAATLEQLTTSRERNRMARELHDVLAHTMSGIAVELEGVRATLHVDLVQAEQLLGRSLRAIFDFIEGGLRVY